MTWDLSTVVPGAMRDGTTTATRREDARVSSTTPSCSLPRATLTTGCPTWITHAIFYPGTGTNLPDFIQVQAQTGYTLRCQSVFETAANTGAASHAGSSVQPQDALKLQCCPASPVLNRQSCAAVPWTRTRLYTFMSVGSAVPGAG